MSTHHRVVLSEDIHPAGKKLLEAGGVRFVLAPDTTEATAVRLLADADGLILRASTRVTREVLRGARRLRVIARTGVGYDNVDVAAASELGILVTIVPGANANSVAEHAIAMMLAWSKQVFFMDRATRKRDWSVRFSEKQREIAGQTLGLLGFGRIGRATARKALALGMRVIAYDPAIAEAKNVDGVNVCKEMKEVLAQADYLSLHLPATPTTRNFINAARLAEMKLGAFLINTARGSLVDEAALAGALREGRLAGAALDVFQSEPPPPDYALFDLPNVILSPHVAGSTVESNERIIAAAAQAVLDVLEGRTPANVVNPEAAPKPITT